LGKGGSDKKKELTMYFFAFGPRGIRGVPGAEGGTYSEILVTGHTGGRRGQTGPIRRLSQQGLEKTENPKEII